MYSLIEITLSVNNLEVRLLFDSEPYLVEVEKAIRHAFRNNEHVREGLCELICSLGDNTLALAVGDEGFFEKDENKIGTFFVQQRTVFQGWKSP